MAVAIRQALKLARPLANRKVKRMKTLRVEMTLASVSVVVERELDEVAMDKFAKLGMASDGYRAVATKAFKGVKDRAALAYDVAEPLVSKAFTDAGYKVISTELYVAPTAEAEMKKAKAVYAEAVKAGTLEKLVAKLKLDPGANEQAAVEAIHAKLYPSKESVLAALLK